MGIDVVLGCLKSKDVVCRRAETDREGEDTIAVFGYGDLTRKEIVEIIADNDLTVMFFEGSIREDEYRKRVVQ